MISANELRIRLIGWYGFNATGDDLIAECIKSLFMTTGRQMGIKVVFTDSDDCDLGLIGGGTIIGCDSAGILALVKQISAPIAIFGPGFRNMGKAACKQWRSGMNDLFRNSIFQGVRGPLTVQQLRSEKMAQHSTVIGDPAIWFERIKVPWQYEGKKTVGICIREMAKEDQEERYLSSSQTFNLFSRIVPAVLEHYDAVPIFLSFCENDYDSDSQGAQKLRNELPEKYRGAQIVEYKTDVNFAATIISKMDYLISERMHPSILAWVAGKPCIMFDYQYRKAEDFMDSIGFPQFCFRTDNINEQQYMEALKSLEDAREEVVNQSHSQFARQRYLQTQASQLIIQRALELRNNH